MRACVRESARVRACVHSMGGLDVNRDDDDDDDVQILNGGQGSRYSIASAPRSSAASQCDTVAYQELFCPSPPFPPFSQSSRNASELQEGLLGYPWPWEETRNV